MTANDLTAPTIADEAEVEIPASARTLLEGDKHATAITINRNGTPQASLVWVGLEGNEIAFPTDERSAKARNLRLNPVIVLVIADTAHGPTGHLQHLVVRGRARIEGPGIPEAYEQLTDRYAERYWPPDKPVPRREPERGVIVYVTPTRLSGVGPWSQRRPRGGGAD